jgi:SAM-dependent methyltransferase
MQPSVHVIPADLQHLARGSDPRAKAVDPAIETAIDPAVQRLVARAPLRSRVLEIGCGSGAFTRELASRRGARITAIDLAARMIDIARVRTRESLGVDYRVADFMALSPRGFDVAVAIDAMHDMPLALAASRMAAAVVPGGLVLIADRFAPGGTLQLPYDAVSSLLGRTRPDVTRSLREIRASLRAALPGVAIRRHLGWRFTAVWQRPAQHGR